jgi:hypothetical protein
LRRATIAVGVRAKGDDLRVEEEKREWEWEWERDEK